jgi:hypothetical protein
MDNRGVAVESLLQKGKIGLKSLDKGRRNMDNRGVAASRWREDIPLQIRDDLRERKPKNGNLEGAKPVNRD